MLSLHEAQAYVLGQCAPPAPISVPVPEALGLVSAEPIMSKDSIPPFANTAMDGFAVRSADTADAPVDLIIAGTIAAGARPDIPVEPGHAVRIMTGAPMPPGADAVIMVELTSVSEAGQQESVTVLESVPVGNHVREAGEDMRPGQQVFDPGTELRPGHLGVLCTLGVLEILAYPAPRVGVISTGDELVEGDTPLEPGQIRDSNRRTLLSLVAQAGAIPIDLGLIRDDEDLIREGLINGAAQCDALITSGGVSMGDFDYVKKVLNEIAEMRWMQVAIKPAKPLAFGTIGSTPIFGLPGNPVSSMVSFELFARPGLRKMMGHADLHRPHVMGIPETQLRHYGDGKTHFARVVATYLDGAYRFSSAGGQGSHQLSAMAVANALAILPDETLLEENSAGGGTVQAMLLA